MLRLIGVRQVVLLSLVLEAMTAFAVLLAPSLVARLLFAAEVQDAGVLYGGLLGIGLLALVVACWPGATVAPAALRALLVFNLLAGGYLAYVGIVRPASGWLLWPAIGEHALVALLLSTETRRETRQNGA